MKTLTKYQELVIETAMITLARIVTGNNENGSPMDLQTAVMMCRITLDLMADSGMVASYIQDYIDTGKLPKQVSAVSDTVH